MSPGWRILCLAAILASFASASVRADQRQDLQRAREQARRDLLHRQRDHYEQSLRSLPQLPQHRMSDILRLRVERGELVAHTTLQPWQDYLGRRAQVDGLKTPLIVTYTQAAPDMPQLEVRMENYPDDDTYEQFRLQWQPAGGRGEQLSIESTEQTSHSFRRIFYMQGQMAARLLVFGNGNPTGPEPESFNVAERDFASLRRKYPRIVQEYLRPTLRRLQQDATFAPDVDVAWQVLSEDWPVQPGVNQAIIQLLPLLDSDDPRARDRGSADLARLGHDGASAIQRLGRRGLSIEQNVRLDQVVSRFTRVSSAEAQRLRDDPEFLLDCQYCDDATVRRLSVQRLQRLLGHPLALDWRAPERARTLAIEAVRLHLHDAPVTQPTAR